VSCSGRFYGIKRQKHAEKLGRSAGHCLAGGNWPGCEQLARIMHAQIAATHGRVAKERIEKLWQRKKLVARAA
jgi:hypothetical protein